MKRITKISISLILLLIAPFAMANGQTKTTKSNQKTEKSVGFITDFEQAKKEAAAFNQPIFVLFTGSDWCTWCKRLENEVLATETFKNYAKDNFVLFVADFPRQNKLSEEIQKQNKALQSQYEISGYPTVLILDAIGKVKVKTGYRPGGAENYLREINAALSEGLAQSNSELIVGCGYAANQRIDYYTTSPAGVKALSDIEDYLKESGLEQDLILLIQSRVSQINGCAYCLDGHTKDALKNNEQEQRLYLLPVWREAPYYTDRERAALAWAEAVTLISTNEIGDELYNNVRKYFTEKEIVDLTYCIVAINGWNRLAISMRSPVGVGW